MIGFIITLVVAAGVGIVVGLVAWRKFLSEWSNALSPVALLSIIAISAAGVFLAGRSVIKRRTERQYVETAGLALYGRPSSASLSADLLLPLLQDPRLVARLEALGVTAGPQVGLSAVQRAGVARLDGDTRAALFDIRQKLAGFSPVVCAGFWTGSVGEHELTSAIRNLDEVAQRTWIAGLAHAGELELAATSGPERVPRATRDAAMMELATTLSAGARAAFDRASSTERPTVEEACAAFRALAEGVPRVASATRQLILRIAMNPEVVDAAQ